LSNSQCSLNASGSTATTSGNNLTLAVPVTFTSAFQGSHTTQMYAAGVGGQNSGWQTMGSWNVTPISLTSVTPTSGSGANQTFTVVVNDSLGATNLNTVYLWFNTTTSGGYVNSCAMYYDRPSNTVFLSDNTGSTW